jgi:hypothetical protein
LLKAPSTIRLYADSFFPQPRETDSRAMQEEITELIGDRWEYVFTHEEFAYFRKRK